MSLESNEHLVDKLIVGAEQAAAGKTLGLSPEETFNLQQYLRQRGIKQVRAEDNAPDPFGEAPEQARDDRGQPVGEARRPQDDFRHADKKFGKEGGRNIVARQEKVNLDVLPEEFLNDFEVAQQREGRDRQKVNAGEIKAGKGLNVNPGAAAGRGPRDAQNRLLDALDQFGPEAFGSQGPEMVRLEQRLNEVNNAGPVGLARGRREARAMIEADKRPFTSSEIDRFVAAELQNRFGGEFGWGQPVRAMPIDAFAKAEREIRAALQGKGGQDDFAVLMNEARAARQANDFRNQYAGIARQFADENIGRIREIRDLGRAGDGVRGVMMQRVENPNSPTTGQELNAPPQGPLPRQQRWMVDNLPDFGVEGGDSFGFPQVGIMEEGKLFADRLRAKGFNVPKQEVRNLNELQAAADFVIRNAAAKGQRLGRFDRESGKMVFTDNPGIQEVLYKLGYSEGEIGRLANAMNQIEQQAQRGFNQQPAANFAARIPNELAKGVSLETNVEGMRADGGLPIEMIRNEKVGRGKNQKNVRGQLAKIGPEDVVRALDEAGQLYTQTPSGQKVLLPEAARIIEEANLGREDAQKPMIAGVKGEVKRAEFIRGNARGMDRAERVRRFGKDNADRADRVEANFLAGEERRKRREEGQQLVKIGGGGFKNNIEVDFPEVSRTDAGSGFRNVAIPQPKQPIQQAATPSIAPTPGDITGSQPTPMTDAGMGGGQPPARTAVAAGGEEPKYKRMGYMTQPDLANRKSLDSRKQRADLDQAKRMRTIRYGAGALAGAGGTAVLGNILFGGRQEEEAVR